MIEPRPGEFYFAQRVFDLLKKTAKPLRVAQQLGETYQAAVSEMRTIGLAHSAREKLACFLLEWAANNPEDKGQIRIKLTLTHQEIAQMIGLSRETVTRLLADSAKSSSFKSWARHW